jgi:hypothetical protein
VVVVMMVVVITGAKCGNRIHLSLTYGTEQEAAVCQRGVGARLFTDYISRTK